VLRAARGRVARQVDRHIGHDNLFKRSIILVRVSPLCSSVAWHVVKSSSLQRGKEEPLARDGSFQN